MWNRPSTPCNAVPQCSSRIQMKSSRATQRKSPTTKCLAVLRTQDGQRGGGAWQDEGAATSVSKYWRTTIIHHSVQDQHPSRSPTANSILSQQWEQRTRCRRNMQGTVHEGEFERAVKLELEQLWGGNRSGEHDMEHVCQDRIAGEDLRRKPAQRRSETPQEAWRHVEKTRTKAHQKKTKDSNHWKEILWTMRNEALRPTTVSVKKKHEPRHAHTPLQNSI